MNLTTCTPGQRESVQKVNGPLLVSAGAGSGKTFTLTQRIAYALLPESGPAATSVDEILAITFTDKAASEIKARVKRTLRSEGLIDEALKVDAAWISTIHGMCARILRTHALELGIDPAFGMVSDAQQKNLLAAAIDEVLGCDNDIVDHGSYAALFNEYPARSSQASVPSIESMLEALFGKAVGLRKGLDAINFGPPPLPASAMARELLLAFEDAAGVLDQAGASASAEKARMQAGDAIAALKEYCATNAMPTSRQNDHEGGHDFRALAKVVDSCVRIGKNFGSAEVKAQIARFQEVHSRICCQVSLALAWPQAAEIMALARNVLAIYEAKKHAMGTLDNDDLLIKTLEAFENYPEIAQRYGRHFKLVMVDEFQDTSQMQIDLISHMAGSRFERLCTVGDAQQSIYRFRGADVNVYEAHKKTMQTPEVGALYVELTKNFRSHADVLSFVDRIFEQPQVFGASFMSLESNASRPSSYRGRGPRIDVTLSVLPAGKNKGVSVADARKMSAQVVAERFAVLRDQGHRARDMVVLLGKMTNADLYAQALRSEGFECAITGGSLFAAAPEVRVVARLAEVLVNPGNTSALFEVLASDLMNVGTDDLLDLSTDVDELTSEMRRCDLDRGIMRLIESPETLSPVLVQALDLLVRAQQAVRTQHLSVVIQDALVRSGWMFRLQQEGAAGIAVAANLLKAVRFLEQLEQDLCAGVAGVSRAFTNALEVGLKEAPGALTASGGDMVKIMTIHASKGLEFPLVALAEFEVRADSSPKLMIETCGKTARASLAPYYSIDEFPTVKKHTKGALEEGDEQMNAAKRLLEEDGAVCNERGHALCSQDAYRASVKERAQVEELAEARRKLYVGLTRASEALVVVMDGKAASKEGEFSYTPLIDDIRSALCGEKDFPEGESFLEYGGTMPARFERRPVLTQVAAVDNVQNSKRCVAVPRLVGKKLAVYASWNERRARVFSYSSLASAHASKDYQKKQVDTVAQEGGEVLEIAALFDGDTPLISFGEGDAVRTYADADQATGLGSAFHRAAQFAVEAGDVPSRERLDALARAFDLSAAQHTRFIEASERWFASMAYRDTLEWPLCRAEVPFSVMIDGCRMEGEIDLLCSKDSSASGEALVVDYKTGGTAGEAIQQLYAKHLLQAQCYAYALLVQGFAEIELRFVRVERVLSDEASGAAENNEPQTVVYKFSSADKDTLRQKIIEVRSQK